MNIHIGIDIVDIDRFTHFETYSTRQLSRIFSPEEIHHCLTVPQKSAERFAARFAFKEALFKALSNKNGTPPCGLLKLFRYAHLTQDRVPQTIINWEAIGVAPQKAVSSFTHTKNTACAVVVVVDQ